jgi:hypothetical protein
MVDAYFDGEGYEWREVKGADHVRASMGAALDVATAGYVTPEAHAADDWESDPAADERWVAGCDFAIFQLASVLGIKPDAFSWDAATEELDGDVRAVIGNALTAAFGDDWSPEAHAAALAHAEHISGECMAAEQERDIARQALAASQADVARLRSALKPFAVALARDHPIFGDSSHELISTTLGDIRRARAALAASQPQGGE